MYEKVHAAVLARFDAATGVKRRLIDWALPIGREVSRLEARGQADAARASRDSTGSPTGSSSARCASRSAGGCACPARAARRSRRRSSSSSTRSGIRIAEGYGLTECTTAAQHEPPERYRFGSVGQPLPGFEVRIADDGEILVRARPSSRATTRIRRRRPRSSAPTAGCKTGDIGELDEDGFLHITDRKKDILVTAGGKNVAPQNIENDLKTSKYVSQALVVGDARPYVAALVTLDPAEIGRWAAEQEHRRRSRPRSRATSACGSSSRASSTTPTASARASSR